MGLRTLSGSLVVGLVLSGGCTFVSRAAFEEKRNSLDEDGDGSAWADDCDDKDGNRSPDFDETPYDGIDNDCAGDGDLLDVDNDTYPGIAEEDYQGDYPARFAGRPLDCVDDPAFHEKAHEIFPGSTDEEPYDGIDSDCDGQNDYDNDGDGYMPDTASVSGATVDVAEAYAQYVADWGYEDLEAGWGAPAGLSAPETGDCHDSDPVIHPNPAEPDVWYDGEDSDCDGRNDFDADEDGWMPAALPDGSETSPAYTTFVNFYYDGSPPWTLPADQVLSDGTVLDAFSDCLDLADQGIAVAPAAVYPGAKDAFYDGIDSNCWADNDFDRDLDGYYQDVDAKAYLQYVGAWDYADREQAWAEVNPLSNLTAPAGGDCDDTDPSAWPGALETIGDGADQDCDTLPDGTAFGFHTYLWEEPSPPRMTRVGSYYVVAVTAAWAELLAEGTDVGEALFFHLDDANGQAVPSSERAWKTSSSAHRIFPAMDVYVDPTPLDTDGDGLPDPAIWFVGTYSAVGTGFVYMYGTELHYDSSSGNINAGPGVYNFVDQAYVPGSVEVALDPNFDEPYLLACGDDVLHAVRGTAIPPTDPELEDLTAGLGGTCFLDGDPVYDSGSSTLSAPFTRCGPSGCESMSLDGVTTLSVSSLGTTGEAWTAGDYHDGGQVLFDASGPILRDLAGGQDYPLFTGETVLSADAMLYGGELYMAAVIDVGGVPEVRLRYGDPLAGLAEIVLPYQHPTLPNVQPEAVSLYVDADRIALAVTGSDPLGAPESDTVGWVFLGH